MQQAKTNVVGKVSHGKRLFIACGLLVVQLLASANVRLPSLVSDHMLLQRAVPIPVWGWADPGEKISILFNQQTFTAVTGADGKWRTQFPVMGAGGPFNIIIRGNNEIIITDVLIGDVWLASGQSNMEWQLSQHINNFRQEIAAASYPQIRLFDVKNTFSIIELDTLQSEGWKVCSPETAGSFSATAYFFGRHLYQQYHIPIGLITADWGGTQIEAWMSLKALKKFPEFADKIQEQEKSHSLDMFKQRLDETLTAWQLMHTSKDAMYLTANRTSLPGKNIPTMVFPGLWEREPSLAAFDGVIWFQKSIYIPEADAGKPAILHLAMVNDVDSTWFNGQKIGGTCPFNANRVYTIPASLVKAGYNSIMVRVLDLIGGGGIYGNADDLFLQTASSKITLAGEWYYQVGASLAAVPIEKRPVTIFGENSLAALYNGMIHPLLPYAIKGAIWYQGEANVARAYQYRSLFQTMIRDWRSKWGYDFPFLFVQLASFMHDKAEPADYEWAELREAQGMALSLPKTGMAVTIDIGDPDNIHPTNKQDVGKRLALAAQKVAYGNDSIVASGPSFLKMSVNQGKVIVSFSGTGSGLVTNNKDSSVGGFAIAGANRKFYWARGYIKNNTVILTCDEVDKPVAVRYNWGNSPGGNLYNKENLPALPFRTDNWPGSTFGIKQ